VFRPTLHPVLKIPTAQQAARMGERKWLDFMTRREELIAAENHDPLRHGYEPPLWRLADALRGTGLDPDMDARIRRALGFEKPVRVLALLGGNRAGKTEYAGKRVMGLLNERDNMNCWAFHQTAPISVETHHKLMWRMLPPELRHTVKGVKEYIAWKQKTGFSDNKFVLRNGSECVFKFYAMEREDALQSAELDMFWCDELVPPDWIDDLLLRIASRAGCGLVTFTPIQGYSPTVRMLQDGAVPVLEQTAFMLPKDRGEALRPQALGFESEGEMRAAHAQERWSLPTRFEIEPDGAGGERLVAREPATPEGRKFQRLPRVMKCADSNFAIMMFWSQDNPYGKPHEILELVSGKSEDFRKERFYGMASRTMSTRFPKFSRKVHVVPASAIPREGTDYHFADPAQRRNFCMHWYRVTKDAAYLVREWPGTYPIPKVGIPGPWALPDGKRLDGRPGPGQRSFGFGLMRLKQEIARLEEWTDWAEAQKAGEGKSDPAAWRAERGAKQRVFERYLDSRAASAPKMENDRPRTLMTDFDDIGLTFLPTPGDSITDGVNMIVDALDYDDETELDYFNAPKFFVCEDCENAIYALETWTGEDGQKGACKDPIDLIRYFFLSDCGYVSEDHWETSGGGYH
jgi:hypothetical protein